MNWRCCGVLCACVCVCVCAVATNRQCVAALGAIKCSSAVCVIKPGTGKMPLRPATRVRWPRCSSAAFSGISGINITKLHATRSTIYLWLHTLWLCDFRWVSRGCRKNVTEILIERIMMLKAGELRRWFHAYTAITDNKVRKQRSNRNVPVWSCTWVRPSHGPCWIEISCRLKP